MAIVMERNAGLFSVPRIRCRDPHQEEWRETGKGSLQGRFWFHNAPSANKPNARRPARKICCCPAGAERRNDALDVSWRS